MKKLSYIKSHQTRWLYFLFLFPSFVLQSFFLFSVSSLFGTQQQLTHSPVKSSTLPFGKMPVFQGVAHRQINFTLSYVSPLCDSATAYSPSVKELKPSLQEGARFSGCCTSVYNFHFILRHLPLGLSNSSLTLR